MTIRMAPTGRPMPIARPRAVAPRAAAVAAQPAVTQPRTQTKKRDEGFFEGIGRWIDERLSPDPEPVPARPNGPKAPTGQDPAPAPTPTPVPVPSPTPAPAGDLPILTHGDTGELVLFMQKRLGEVGFPLSATPNGVFGPATLAAVKAFQKAHGIPTTGNVGPLTWAALGVTENPIIPRRAPRIQMEKVAALLGVPAETFKRNWPYLARALAEAGLTDRATVIAVLATIRIEAPGFEPIHEYGGPSYWARYNDREDLGNRPGTNDGVVYHGRGYIQLTGRANYTTYGRMLGVDLVGNPDLALDPEVSARVLVAYMKSRGIPAMARRGDWIGVRRAVNGGTNGWDVFAGYVDKLVANPALLRAPRR